MAKKAAKKEAPAAKSKKTVKPAAAKNVAKAVKPAKPAKVEKAASAKVVKAAKVEKPVKPAAKVKAEKVEVVEKIDKALAVKKTAEKLEKVPAAKKAVEKKADVPPAEKLVKKEAEAVSEVVSKAPKKEKKVKIDKAASEDLLKWNELHDKYKAMKAQAYSISGQYEAKTPIQHKIFGWGFILSNEYDRLEVLFEDGKRMLISNRKLS